MCQDEMGSGQGHGSGGTLKQSSLCVPDVQYYNLRGNIIIMTNTECCIQIQIVRIVFSALYAKRHYYILLPTYAKCP